MDGKFFRSPPEQKIFSISHSMHALAYRSNRKKEKAKAGGPLEKHRCSC